MKIPKFESLWRSTNLGIDNTFSLLILLSSTLRRFVVPNVPLLSFFDPSMEIWSLNVPSSFWKYLLILKWSGNAYPNFLNISWIYWRQINQDAVWWLFVLEQEKSSLIILLFLNDILHNNIYRFIRSCHITKFLDFAHEAWCSFRWRIDLQS